MPIRPVVQVRAASLIGLLTACVLSILIVVSFAGVVPRNTLDFSWAYGVAVAEAQRIPFGADLVFTFGPLSFLYSHFALPAQRPLYLALSVTMVLTLCLAVTAVARPGTRWAVILLPFVLANSILQDGFLLVLPLPIVLIASAPWERQRAQTAALVWLAGILGLLPLVKGTMTVPAAACIAIATSVLLLRRRMVEAVTVPGAAITVMVACWFALGQPLSALPLYFGREAYIAAGYTDAMSLWGDVRQIYVYIGCAAALLIAVALPLRRTSAAVALAFACILFVGFKAAFVRHDEHAMIGTSVLLLASLISALNRPSMLRIAAAALCVAGWAAIDGAYVPVGFPTDVDRLVFGVWNSGDALLSLARDPDSFDTRFDQARAQIAADADLPPTDGTVDLYAVEQAAILASGRIYNPRPILQSYSAYTPELAALNAEHLSGPAAPRTIFFEITPIDGRYPSLDDGASWPALLSAYSFRQFAGDFAVLDRSAVPESVSFDAPAIDADFPFDQDISVPPTMSIAWAVLDIRPTTAGRLISAAWKLPLLTIDVAYADGHTDSYRLIAGMAAAGFLLSPTISTAYDFVVLRANGAPATLDDQVRSFRVHQDGSSTFWGKSFRVRLAEMRLPADRGAAFAVKNWAGDSPTALPPGGDCWIDMVGGTINRGKPIESVARYLSVTGWGYASATRGVPSTALRIAVTAADGTVRYAEAERHHRPDLDAIFKTSAPNRAGFEATIDLAGLTGPFDLTIVQDGPDGLRRCPAAPVPVRRPVR